MEIIEKDGEKYKLVPIKEQKLDYFVFILTMPNCGYWNGKWTGAGEVRARVMRAIMYRKPLYPNVKEKNYYYNFGDGWGANIQVKLVTKREAKEYEKKSVGFAGYDWMIDSIIEHGRILSD